tara:strand:+ start:8339 stop:9268 length:930 start_codon:yes stop_codon:yes gene_type:complete
MKKILLIKHGSFGDIILATGAMKSIKNHFSNYEICVLTSRKYKDFFEKAPFIDRIFIDDRKSLYNIINNFLLVKKIININFDYIFDLQNSYRTSIYNLIFRIFTKSIISSSRKFAQYRYIIPRQGVEHSTTGLNNQLSLLGIKTFFLPDLEWLKEYGYPTNIRKPFVIIIPGTSANGLHKRWSSKKYSIISEFLEKKGYNIVVAGTNQDYDSALHILNNCSNPINLLGKSPPEVLYKLSKKAKIIISNDTGPAFLASLSNNPLIWIVNDNAVSLSNKPIGKNVIKISEKNINNISAEKVIDLIKNKKLI